MSILFLIFLLEILRPIPYYDPEGRLPSHFEDYQSSISEPYNEVVLYSAPKELIRKDSIKVLQLNSLAIIFINSGLYPEIQSELQVYLQDLQNEGYRPKVILITGGRAQNLRQTLQAHRDSGLVGSVMIGSLPVAWWEDSNSGEDYPIDLFFSDLDGVFADNDGDGKYDSHTGSAAPDIWVGRIHPGSLTYDGEANLVKSYLQRNHLYRTGQLPVPSRGLVYNEVTWYPNNHGMNYLYSDITMFNDENTTTAYHYKNQLRLGYEFVHLIAHSSPWAHTFFLANDQFGGGSVFNFEIPALAPNACFYFLNACMCTRFLEKDNLGNWYLFAQPWGLVVMGSTQLMYGISDLSTIYRALGRDSSFGDAFLKWHRSTYSSFRGTGILGDPTLKVNRKKEPLVQVNPPSYRKGEILNWTEYVVDTVPFVNGNPAIGYSQGRIRIVFDSGRIVRSDNYFSSFDGSRFTRPESIAWHEYYDFFPACATDRTGRFWVVWQSFRDYNSGYDHFQLFSCYYHNGSWSGVSRVGPLAGHHDVQPALASAGDTIWCAFKSWRAGQGDIWLSYEVGGSNWSNPVRLTTDSLDQIDPTITVDRNNYPWIFWTSQRNGKWCLQGRRYEPGSPIFNLDTIGNNSSPKAITDNSGRIWVIWHKFLNNQADIYYSYYDGTNWLSPQPVTNTPFNEILPDITPTPDGRVWATWQGDNNGYWDIYISYYQDGWSYPQPITNDPANDYDPVITTDASGNIWVAWASDRRNYWHIYAAVSPPTGIASKKEDNFPIQILPNPFSQKGRFSLPKGFVLEIYSPTGQRVATLSQKEIGNLPSGVYLVKIKGKNYLKAQKIVVVD